MNDKIRRTWPSPDVQPKKPRSVTNEPLKRRNETETLQGIAAILATKSESDMSESELSIAVLLVNAGIVSWHRQAILVIN